MPVELISATIHTSIEQFGNDATYFKDQTLSLVVWKSDAVCDSVYAWCVVQNSTKPML